MPNPATAVAKSATWLRTCGLPSFRDTFRLARRRLAAAPQVCKNAARTWSLDVERSSSGFVRSRTVHTHAASLQVRGWPLDSDSRGCAR